MKEIAKNNYYEISVDTSKNRLYLKVKGFWKEKTEVPNYLKDMRNAGQSLSRGFTVLADLQEMKAPSPEIGVLHQETQAILVQAGLDRTAEVLSSAITKMSTSKYTKTSGMKKMDFSSTNEAEKWLDTKV